MFKFEAGDKVEYRSGQYLVKTVGMLTLWLENPNGKRLYAGKSECTLVPPTPLPHTPWVPFDQAYVNSAADVAALVASDAIDKCMEK